MNHEDDSGRIREEVRKTSKALVGNKHALDVRVAVGLADPPVVYPRELALSLRIGENQTARELEKLAIAGALQELEADGESRRFFQRLPHPVWEFSKQVVAWQVRAAATTSEGATLAEYWKQIYNAPLPAELDEAVAERNPSDPTVNPSSG
jgi:hypothetical protein